MSSDILDLSMVSEESLLEAIYASLRSEVVDIYKPGRSKEWLLARIGALTGLNFRSGYETDARKYARLYKYVNGVDWIGEPNILMMLYLSIVSVNTVEQSIVDALFAYWPLASNGAVDLNEYIESKNLTNTNLVTRAAGPTSVLPDAAHFVAASLQYLTAPSGFTNLSGKSFTVAIWCKINATTAGTRVYDNGTASGTRSFNLFVNGTTQMRSQLSNVGSTVVVADNLPNTPAGWHLYLLEVDIDAGTALLTADLTASQAATVFAGGVYGSGLNTLRIGASHTPANYASMDACALAIFDKILSTEEKEYLYNDGDGVDLTTII